MANVRLKSLLKEIVFVSQIQSSSLWIKSNGTIVPVKPKDGKYFSLEEMYQYTNGGPIQMVATKDGRIMILNEEGKLTGLPLNKKATELYKYGSHDPIVGDVLVCDEKYLER